MLVNQSDVFDILDEFDEYVEPEDYEATETDADEDRMYSLEQTISMASSDILMSKEFLETIFDIDDEVERERFIGLIGLRAKDIKCSAPVNKVINTMRKSETNLTKIYGGNTGKKFIEIGLSIDGRGVPQNTIDNFIKILRADEYFKGLSYNELTATIENNKVPWADIDDAKAKHYIENTYKIYGESKYSDALRTVASERSYNPVKLKIESIKWDKKSRIRKFLPEWLLCGDDDYTREVSRLIFAGGINRLYNPGCKFDDVAVLVGTNQGEGKSTLIRWLAMDDKHFTEITTIEGQKGMEILHGAWVCEIAEMFAVTRAKEVEAVKAYITRQNDRYRKPFDKYTTENPRRCFFVGTTNNEQFLTDKTGNRRYYPIKVNSIGYDLFDNEKKIKKEIEQCWAEAKALYDKGKMPPYFDRTLLEEARLRQQNAVEDDYREGLIKEYLEDKDRVCAMELWFEALNNPSYSKPTRRESNEIILIMSSLIKEWKRLKDPARFGDYGTQRGWRRRKKLNPSDTNTNYDEDLLDAIEDYEQGTITLDDEEF